MTDIVENEEIDRDTIDATAIEKQFAKKYEMLTQATVSQKKTYINKISGTKSMKFAVILPDNGIEVYALNNVGLARTCHLLGHEKKVTEVVFNPREDNMLFSASEDGVVKMWDVRAGGKFVQDYKDEEEEMIRPYECMDVSYNGRVLCAGSQVVEDDAYLVFWDQRNPKPLGGYWNSHTEDVTQVKFHKEKMEILATGSIDGLVNVFDITEQTEDDALTYSLNIENALEKITWLDDKLAACVTQCNDMQIWNLHTGDLVNVYKREKVARGIKRTRADDCYLVDAFMSAEGSPVLLAGSYGGCEDTLRSVRISGRCLRPRTDFSRNRQIVRTCWYDDDTDVLLTAGESGIINVWRGIPCDQDMEMDSEVDNYPESHTESERENELRRGGDNAQMDAESGDSDGSDDSDESDQNDGNNDNAGNVGNAGNAENAENNENDMNNDIDENNGNEIDEDDDKAPSRAETAETDENTAEAADDEKSENDKADDDDDDEDDDSSDSSSDSDSSSSSDDGEAEEQETAPGKLTAARDKLHANRHKPY